MKPTIDYSFSILQKIFGGFIHSPFSEKVTKLALGGWMFFAGIHVYFYYIIALTVIDVITGVMASIKKGEPFKSKILRKGLIEKGILFNALMISVFFLEMIVKTAISYDPFYMVMISAMLIGTYEVSSIVENLLVINPKLNFLKSILKMSNNMHDKTIEIAEKKIDEVSEYQILAETEKEYKEQDEYTEEEFGYLKQQLPKGINLDMITPYDNGDNDLIEPFLYFGHKVSTKNYFQQST